MLRISILFCLCTMMSAMSRSQTAPVLANGSNMPAVGFADSIRLAAGSNVGPAGANVTWDFSSLSTTHLGTFSVVSPASTPYASTFPTANYAVQLTPAGAPGSVYEYYTVDATGIYINASGYSTATTTNNYTPNSKLRIPFPFSFGNSKTDTFQKVGSSLDAYAITYDGWGTLKVPGATYNNVVRIKYEWVGGEIAYNWFTTAPLFYVATWSQNSGGQFNFLGKSLASPTAVSNPAGRRLQSLVFPTPASASVTLSVSGLTDYRDMSCQLTDVNGRMLSSVPVSGPLTEIRRDGLAAGLYFYQLRQNGQPLSKGKLVFE